ncbi:MAG: hypothetical protein ACYDCQ_22665 [Dehalococcoidia bacterium]
MRCKRRLLQPVPDEPAALAPVAIGDGRWRLIRNRWNAELHEALRQTKGNLELAIALATTMVFMD